MASLCRRLLALSPRVVTRASPLSTRCMVKPRKAQPVVAQVGRNFSATQPLTQKETVTLHFLLEDGEKQTVKAKAGDNLLDIIIDNDVDIDGFGACEGTLACSTCHLIFSQSQFDTIENKPTDEEMDMLDLAYGLTDTSRLGCQVVVTKDMEGWEISVPEGVADAREV